MATSPTNQPRRTLLLTGASRGIGHFTVKRFSAAGWRVITCSRHPFPENCPWEAGPEDHIQVDLADPEDTLEAISEITTTLRWVDLSAVKIDALFTEASMALQVFSVAGPPTGSNLPHAGVTFSR